MMDVFFDMETGDPDDAIALLYLVDSPHVTLRLVTVFPGGQSQIGFVKGLLRRFDHGHILVGKNKDSAKNHLNPGMVRLFAGDMQWQEEEADGFGCDLMEMSFSMYPDATVVTGGPLGNLYDFLMKYDTHINRVFIQGGFAGDRVMEPDDILPKFEGKSTCATWNFAGHIKGAECMLETDKISEKFIISKDVCHGVKYDEYLHFLVKELKLGGENDGIWGLLYMGMKSYLKKKPFKLIHDPLAVCAFVNPDIITFKEVMISRDLKKKGEWGSILATDTNTFISTKVDMTLLYSTYLNVSIEEVERATQLYTKQQRRKKKIPSTPNTFL